MDAIYIVTEGLELQQTDGVFCCLTSKQKNNIMRYVENMDFNINRK